MLCQTYRLYFNCHPKLLFKMWTLYDPANVCIQDLQVLGISNSDILKVGNMRPSMQLDHYLFQHMPSEWNVYVLPFPWIINTPIGLNSLKPWTMGNSDKRKTGEKGDCEKKFVCASLCFLEI